MRRAALPMMCLVAFLFVGLAASPVMADDRRANATVSFGQWQTAPPFDRFPPSDPNDRTRNEHRVLPHEVKIKAGGAVNFIIGGFHQLLVYDDGTLPSDFNALTTPYNSSNSPAANSPRPSAALYLGTV